MQVIRTGKKDKGGGRKEERKSRFIEQTHLLAKNERNEEAAN